jgi:hypothetical protein
MVVLDMPKAPKAQPLLGRGQDESRGGQVLERIFLPIHPNAWRRPNDSL